MPYNTITTRKANMLLAELGGFTFEGPELQWYDNEGILEGVCKDNCFDTEDLKFHEDWRWLMQLVEHVSNMCPLIPTDIAGEYTDGYKLFEVTLRPDYCSVFFMPDLLEVVLVENDDSLNLFGIIHETMLQLAVWYEENKNQL